MYYNFKKIGERLRKERKAAGFKSQEMLAFKLQDEFGIIHRQRIGRWENGTKIPSMDILLYLCDLFHCDIGYLLCVYDCKTRINTDISEVTGLSEGAIECLKEMNDESKAILNFLLEEDEALWVALENMSNYERAYKRQIEALQNQLDHLEDHDAAVERAHTLLFSDAARGQMTDACNDMIIQKWISHVQSNNKATISEEIKRENTARGKKALHARLHGK